VRAIRLPAADGGIWRSATCFITLLLALTCTVPLQARELVGETLQIGTKVAPPFSMRSADGQWTGISIEMFEAIAEQLQFEVVWQERTLANLLSEVRDGQLDASVAAISVTSSRETELDFSHAYYSSGLGIATLVQVQPGWRSTVSALASPQFLATVGLLCAVLAGVGVVVWLLERPRNADQFSRTPAAGIGSGFWWAAVTMTTVGYGDKTPRSFGGRFVAVIWMFAALILTALLTAQLTTILTAKTYEIAVQSEADLPGARIGHISNSSSIDYLNTHGIAITGFENLNAGFEALRQQKIDALVHDRPLLRWYASRSDENIDILSDLFDRQGYAIALANGSTLREPFNRELLELLASDRWQSIVRKYLGN